MYWLILRSALLASGQQLAVDGVCLDPSLRIETPPRKVIDFKLIRVYAENTVDVVTVYVGYNPNIGPENVKYKTEEFQKALRGSIRVDLQDKGILGVPRKFGQRLFHVHAANPKDAVRVAEKIRFCGETMRVQKSLRSGSDKPSGVRP